MSILSTYIVPHPPMIIPDIGGGEEKAIRRTIDAYHEVAKEIGELKPETIVVISPHSIMYSDYIHISPGEKTFGDFARYGHPKVGMSASYDTALVSCLEEVCAKKNVSAGTLGEQDKALDHGVMVPLYFVNQYLKEYQLCRISISGLTFKEHYAFGQCLQEAIEMMGRKTVIIASGDLSHKLKDEGPYQFAKEGPEFDVRVIADMASGDFLDFFSFSEEFCDLAGECGMRSFVTMAGALDGIAVEPEFLSYEGPFGVGYGVCKFQIKGKDSKRYFLEKYIEKEKQELEAIRSKEDDFVKLARASLESFLMKREMMEVPDHISPELLNNRAGVFVSLKEDGRLRGCIGTIEAAQGSIAEEIIHNAVGAAVGDTRFEPVKSEELDKLIIHVDVLSEPETITSPELLDPKRYGVIVSAGHLKGLLLPDLEGIETVEQQVAIALQKAGIPKDMGFQIQRFEVIRHK